MRISSSSIFENNTTQLNKLQSQLSKTQMQLSTMKRVVVPSDDPIAASRALEVTQSQEINEQLATNRSNARSSLNLVEQALHNATGLIQQTQTLVVNAGNGSMKLEDRLVLATELEGRLTDLLGVANTADGVGGYLFSGYRLDTQPFSRTATGAMYHGDQGQRELQVGSARKIAISDSGSSVFENNATGNGKFQTQAAGANAGTGVISSGTVTNPALPIHNYTISFTVAGTPEVTTYDATDTTTVPPSAVATGTFKSGEPIAFNGISFNIEGAPANGDSFSIKPSEKQSVFETMTQLIAVLRQPAVDAAGKAALTNGLNTANDNLAAAFNNVLTVRTSVGARLKELDYLDEAGDALNEQYAKTLNDLTGLDEYEAISMFAQQQFTLEAAQKTFKAISSLSLFNFI